MRLLTCGGVVSAEIVRSLESTLTLSGDSRLLTILTMIVRRLESTLTLSGDDQHDPAPEPELPRHLQRGRHLRLPGQAAVRQHLSDQVRVTT